MQVHDSSFQKISILVSIVFLLLSLTRCRADTVWGLSRSDFQQRLTAGEREFLREPASGKLDLDEAFRLGPAAPFYLSEILFSLDPGAPEQVSADQVASGPAAPHTPAPRPTPPAYEQTAEQLLDLQWRRGDSPWREEAAARLIRRYLDTERFEQAESLARKLARRAPEVRIEHQAKRDLLEALYWQQKDKAVLNELEEREGEQAPWDDELDLFRAVSSHRLARPGWERLFIDLFFQKRTSDLHARAYAYLEQEEELAAFDPAVSLFFQGKDLLYKGRNGEAAQRIETSLPDLQPERPDMEILIRELAAAYFALLRYEEGAEALLDISAGLSPRDRLAALETAGRLYRKGGNFTEAKRLLLDVVRDTAEAGQWDRAVWFLLDMERHTGRLLESIEQYAPRWHDPGYFADLLEPEISDFVARRDWPGLLALYRLLKGYAPPDTMARLAYLAGRIVSLDLADASQSALPPQALYLEARRVGESSYYSFLAATALADLGFPVEWTLEGEDRSLAEVAGDDQSPEEPPVEMIRGYFDYGLYETGTELLRSRWQSVSPELLLETALLLNDRGEFLRSIRLMNLYALRKENGLDRSDLEILYPRAYGGWIDEVSRDENLPAPVFSALVREESYFDPGIVSRSGAVGLTQLMSETAADSARWLRMEGYDLRDPEQNLRIGAHHFSRLLMRLEDIPKTLMAYNAGLSRLRSWERSYAGLPSDLLAEATPYPETRNYIRKILVSAVYYGALYYDNSLEQTVLSFFPGLR